ncbi:CDP-glycerol glycerophosphotransferase family protein [Lacinutrix sp. C3R15]|uniref:CDP-glycerol glycerophosphotransferase family protein n=1 Tax=Flavobacteriaceae TaxID=49546 RepID=UPI001C0901D6|nr:MULTISPECIES: CDP-glycerol glycerophosphotransferase family protein [Flavobacteriaceae]MBU2940681.1 CDP-glycerol glycerophosphotransferase family protein [Lacinutrix sp. C3R15]MDO6623999.1 CDP-glycerol glycerophosphotransferase family protein [Oceanihabitans sp. 1_MG-2023]
MNYKFLIYISYSYALPIGTPLETEITKRGYTVKWFADIEDGKKAIQEKSNALQTIQEVLSYKPDVVLTATDSVPDFITGLKVQIFHGFNAQKRPSKKNTFSHFRLRGFFDLYCTQGPSTTKGFREQQKKHPYFEVIETGWSKVDPLFPIEKRKQNHTIMIASTFTQSLSLAYNDAVYQEIKRLSTAGTFNFIMVLHPKLPEAIVSKWKSINNSNFKFFNTTDLIPLYKQADIMFADTTSAIQEFLLQKKPVVAFNHTFNHDYLLHVQQAEELEKTFQKALLHPESLIQNIENFIQNLHPYFDGKSSKRVIDATISFLHKDKSYLKQKPLNLVRKYKMRKRLNYFTLKSYNQAYTLPKTNE